MHPLQGLGTEAFSISDLPLAKLTLAQLHELAVAWPAARGSDEWMAAVVLKMYPQLQTDEMSVAERFAFLEAVQEFCDSLSTQVRMIDFQAPLADTAQHTVLFLCGISNLKPCCSTCGNRLARLSVCQFPVHARCRVGGCTYG